MLLCKALEALYLEGAQAAISDGVYISLGVIVCNYSTRGFERSLDAVCIWQLAVAVGNFCNSFRKFLIPANLLRDNRIVVEPPGYRLTSCTGSPSRKGHRLQRARKAPVGRRRPVPRQFRPEAAGILGPHPRPDLPALCRSALCPATRQAGRRWRVAPARQSDRGTHRLPCARHPLP